MTQLVQNATDEPWIKPEDHPHTDSLRDPHWNLTVNGSLIMGLLLRVTSGNQSSVPVTSLEPEDYSYDYEDSVSNIPLDALIPNAIGYGVTLVVGLTGNLLVIISVARYRRMHNVTNIFLLSLATADLLLVSMCVPVKFARFFTFTWQYGEVLCKSVHYMQNLTIICSVLNLTGLSLERYYAILHPMRAKYTCTVSMARRFVVLIWTMSVIMAVPILVGQ
ncbi:QRFP-like peptide receptor, partial [Physella acuta]|uniref:QRFP-like peptide receptor n=1 Tax=Physella acuta TaxID=109671 RepID=UPI0027DE6ED6